MGNQPVVVYSNVWEDPELNRQSLRVKPGESVLSITSGGCNSLCLLLEDPSRVVSIDHNPAQLAMLEYKRAAIMELDYEDFLESIGTPFYRKPTLRPPDDRVKLYQRIKKHMPVYATDFWDSQTDLIRKGIFMCGNVEHFFALYRKMLGWLYDFSTIEKFFAFPNLIEQQRYYGELNKKRWRFLNSCLLNHTVLSMVKGQHSFAMVQDKDLSKNLSRKIEFGMTHFFNPDNYFMALMLLGGHFSRQAMSPYMLEKNFSTMKRNINRLDIYLGTCGDVLKKYGRASFDKLNLSNIFEWMDHDLFNGVIRDCIELMRPFGRMAWRYTLAKPRLLDEANQRFLISEPELAGRLLQIDRSFIYESFHVFRLAEV
ncbi:MAG: DUF3419 family protein [Candidatus Riflebacteria bacterium]|nr:DUF3419 family protein [Candidatus Riflebacteria bacterium]